MNIAAEQVHGVFFHNNLEKNWHFLKKNFCYKMPIIDPNSSTIILFQVGCTNPVNIQKFQSPLYIFDRRP